MREIVNDAGHYPVVLAIISIAKGLGLNLIAEGVETETQAHYLERASCTIMQEFFFHRPIRQKELLQALARQMACA